MFWLGDENILMMATRGKVFDFVVRIFHFVMHSFSLGLFQFSVPADIICPKYDYSIYYCSLSQYFF